MRQLVLRHPGRALVMPVQHLSATEIAAFIDSTLSPNARTAAELHLSECSRCREELASCLRLASTAPGERRWRASGPLAAAAAAAILVVAVLLPNARRQEPRAVRERTFPPTTTRALVIAPAPNAVVDARGLRFVWHRQADAVSYHVAMSDSTGAPVWSSADLSDTVAVLPASVARQTGMRYFWRVDVLHANGSSDQLGTSAFRIAP
jgi:anti-sigma factor RsiW